MHALLEPMSALSLSAHCKASQRLCCRRPCEELTSRRELVSPTTASRLRPLPDRGFSCLLASSLTLHEPHRQTSGGGHVCDSRLADNSEPLSDIARPELSGDGCKKTSRDPGITSVPTSGAEAAVRVRDSGLLALMILSVPLHGRHHQDYADDTDLGPNAVEHVPSEESANEFLGRLESLLRSASNELEPPATLGEYEAQVAALQLECDDPLTFPNVGWEVLDAFDELPRAPKGVDVTEFWVLDKPAALEGASGG